MSFYIHLCYFLSVPAHENAQDHFYICLVSLKISTINYYLVIDYHIMPGRKIPRRWRKPDETQLQDKLSRILSQKR